MEPFEFFALLKRSWAWILVCFVLTLAAAGVAIKRTTPIYEATAEILIVQADPKLRNLFEEGSNADSVTFARDSNPINTHAELLKTKPLLESTIAEADLREAKSGDRMGAAEFAKNLKIVPLKGTDLIKVSFQHSNPRVAAVALNVLCERFAFENVEVSRREATHTLRFLDEQITKTQKALAQDDRALENFKIGHGNFDIKTELEAASLGLSQLNREIGESEVTVREARERIRYLSHELGLSPDETLGMLALGTDPALQRLQVQLAEARTQPILTSGLGEDHPDVRAARAQIAHLEDLIAAQATILSGRTMAKLDDGPIAPVREKLAQELLSEQVRMLSTEARGTAQKAAMANFRARMRKLPQVEQTLAKLNREREFNTETYQQLLKRREQARVAQAMNVGNVRIVQPAETPERPVKPDVKMTLLGAGTLGLLLGVALALGLDVLDDSLRTDTRAREALGSVPITGRLPEMRWLGPSVDAHDLLISDPHAPPELLDAYGLVRLDLVRSLGPQFKLLFAGTDDRDIAPYIANLALSFAQNGRRVLLIDGNLRAPSLHRIFPLEHGLGLRELLGGEASWEDVASKVPHLPLWVVPAFEAEANPLNLLDSPRLWALNQTLGNFDVILGIAPSLTRAPDALALTRIFGNCWLLLHHKRTTRQGLSLGLRLLAERGEGVNGALYVQAGERT